MSSTNYKFYDNSFSLKAKNIINNFFMNKEIMVIYEKLSHDGYDDLGPKSDIWDLVILEKTFNDYILTFWSWDNWFYNDETFTQYKMYNTFKFSKSKNNEVQSTFFHKYFKLCELIQTNINNFNES